MSHEESSRVLLSSTVLSSPPTSCQELKNQNGIKRIRRPMNGIHLLKKNNTIQAAFCIFPANGSPGNISSIFLIVE